MYSFICCLSISCTPHTHSTPYSPLSSHPTFLSPQSLPTLLKLLTIRGPSPSVQPFSLCAAPLTLCSPSHSVQPSSSLWPLYLAPGGESGIRTRDTLLRYTHFPGALLKPLGHLSNTRQHIPHKKGVILPSQWPSAPRCRLCINPLTLKAG